MNQTQEIVYASTIQNGASYQPSYTDYSLPYYYTPTASVIYPTAPNVPPINYALATPVIQPTVSLTQIPYTGFDLGPVGNTLYWAVLIAFAISASYLALYYNGGSFSLTGSLIRKTALKIDQIRGVRMN